MKIKHLNCTTELRRKEICSNYIVHADDCIVLYGGRVVRSDANNREIRDRYYQFKQFAEVVRGFNTNMTAIIEDLLQYGPLRNFDFTDLQNEFQRMFPDEENVFL